MKYFVILLLLFSCLPKDIESSYSDLFVNKYDLILASYSDRDMVSFDLETKRLLQITNLDRTTDTATGAVWMEETGEIAVVYDGRDRVVAIDARDGRARDLIVSGSLNGTLGSITRADNGDFLIRESDNIERFTVNGNRVTSGWPLAVQSVTQIRSRRNGGFLLCAGGAVDQIRLYDDDGNLEASDSGPGGYDANGCDQMSNGDIVVTWNGADEQVWKYSEDLTSSQVLVRQSEIGVMPNPNSIAITKDDHILFSDTTYNHIIELDQNGNFIKTFGTFNNAQDLYIIR